MTNSAAIDAHGLLSALQSKWEHFKMSTNAQRKNKLNASVSEAIIETSKIDTDVAIQCAVETAVSFNTLDKARRAKGIKANDAAFMLFTQLAVVYSANLPVPHHGGIKDTVKEAMVAADVKPKSIDKYNQASANPLFHALLPANSNQQAVEYMCKIYGWKSITAVINAFRSPMPWNAECDAMLDDWQESETYKQTISSHDDDGDAAENLTRKACSDIIFGGMDKKDIEKYSTAKRGKLPSYEKQLAAYEAAEQAAQLAATKKQTKQ